MGRKAIKLTRAEMLDRAKKLSIKNIKKLTNKELMILVAYNDAEKTKKKMMKTILKKDLRKLAGKLGVVVSSKDSKSIMINKLLNTIFAESSKHVLSSSNFNTIKKEEQVVKEDSPTIQIPERYNIDRIKAYPINPEWAHIYWELSDSTINEIEEKLSRGGKLVLRLYDVTFIDFDGKNAHKIMQNDIRLGIKGWYVKHQQPDADFIAEIGILYSNTSYVHILRSNIFHSPRNSVSDDLNEKWVNPKEIISLREKGLFNPIDFNYSTKESHSPSDSLSVEYLYAESSIENILRTNSSSFGSSSISIFRTENYE